VLGARVQARVAVAGARAQHVDVDAQHQQVLAEVVVDFARDALAFLFLDLVRMRGQAAQLVVRLLQRAWLVRSSRVISLAIFTARMRDDDSVWNSRKNSSEPVKPHAIASHGSQVSKRLYQLALGALKSGMPVAVVEVDRQHHVELVAGRQHRAMRLAVEQAHRAPAPPCWSPLSYSTRRASRTWICSSAACTRRGTLKPMPTEPM
jgi:hypothetical protein